MKRLIVAVITAILILCSSNAKAGVWIDTEELLNRCTDDRTIDGALSRGICVGVILASVEIASEFVACSQGGELFMENEKGCEGTRTTLDLPTTLTVGDIRYLTISYIKRNPDSFKDQAQLTIFKALMEAFGIKNLPAKKRI
jgi:hypothetical protein